MSYVVTMRPVETWYVTPLCVCVCARVWAPDDVLCENDVCDKIASDNVYANALHMAMLYMTFFCGRARAIHVIVCMCNNAACATTL